MVSSGDIEYIHTKRIKKGQLNLESPFLEFAEWFLKIYGFRPLNIIYDIIEHNKRPRLQVIFEKYQDVRWFRADNKLFLNSTRQEEVAAAFRNLILDYPQFSADNLYVIFNSFEPIAKEEANGKISNQRLDKLKSDLSNNDIWEIRRNFSTGIFFFYTMEQAITNETNGTKEKLKEEYFKLIKECDEFDYIKKESFDIKIDSKENFDENYQSNWFYYFKDN